MLNLNIFSLKPYLSGLLVAYLEIPYGACNYLWIKYHLSVSLLKKIGIKKLQLVLRLSYRKGKETC